MGPNPRGIAVGAGAIWVTDQDDNTVRRIDPATNEVTDTIGVGDAPETIVVDGDDVWVVNEGDQTVSRIDSTAL